MTADAVRYYLEMTGPDELRPSPEETADVRIERQEIPDAELIRYLYTAVGGDWHWVDWLDWTDAQWLEYLDQPSLEMWVLYVKEAVAGYFVLKPDSENSVELAFFGLIPEYIGRGLGGHLLTVAIRRAWDTGASRVWLHTSTRDHPNALSNYKARGFRVFKQEVL